MTNRSITINDTLKIVHEVRLILQVPTQQEDSRKSFEIPFRLNGGRYNKPLTLEHSRKPRSKT